MSEITQLLAKVSSGDASASEHLLNAVYSELRRIARFRMARERSDHTLQPTALVHEAYLRIMVPKEGREENDWKGRGHFFTAAAEAMRRILIESARRRKALRHGGEFKREDRELELIASDSRADELLALNEALEKLHTESPRKAQLVQLRYFAGVPHREAAEILGLSRATADRDWAYAKAFLKAELE